MINMPLYNNSPLSAPDTIKTTVENNDYLICIDSSGELYKITKANFLAGSAIPSGSYLTWLFNESSGTTASDSSGSNPGVYVDCTLNGSDISLNGTSSRVSQSSSIAALTSYSISLDFQTSFNSAGQGLWEFRASQDLSSGTFAPGLILNSAGNIRLYGFPNSSNFSTQAFNDGAWHKSMCLLSNGSVKIFVDGTKILDQAISPIAAFTGFFTLGATRSGGYFAGKMKNFRIWNSLLSDAQAIAATS